MGEMHEPPQLRPLSIGEIFDRAVTLFVRNWVPFTIVGALAVIPSHVAMYFARAQSVYVLNSYWMPAFYVLSVALLFGTLATGRLVAQIYRSRETDWRNAAALAMRKLLPAIGANLTIVLIALLPLLIVVGIPAGAGVFRLSNLFSDVVALIVLICGGSLYVAMYFSMAYALNAMAIDDYRAMDGVGRALSLFNGTMGWRTLIVGLAQVAIVAGGSWVAGAVGQMTTIYLHNAAAGTGIGTLIVFMTSIYGNIVTSIFYFDVAIRSEGYDLQVALDAMPS